jgi:hypothetical protein
MMPKKSKMEELSVVADPWNLKLKPAKLKGVSLDKRFTRYTFTHFGSRS